MFLVYSTPKHGSPEDSLTSLSLWRSEPPAWLLLSGGCFCMCKRGKKQGNLLWKSLD